MENDAIQISRLEVGNGVFRLIGTTPLYCNALSSAAKLTLLAGGKRKTTAEKAAIKHDAIAEFQESIYCIPEDGPTLCGFPAGAIKQAMATAALESAGITKSSVFRCVKVPEGLVPLWGKPKLKMDVVRLADRNRTRDIRVRAYFPRWGIEIPVSWVQPMLGYVAVATLLANAGQVCGIGDYRQEHGRGSFGSFTVTGTDPSPEWAEIVAEGREEQAEAICSPEAADDASAELCKKLAAEARKRK